VRFYAVERGETMTFQSETMLSDVGMQEQIKALGAMVAEHEKETGKKVLSIRANRKTAEVEIQYAVMDDVASVNIGT
jgi:hypothetical protein